MAGKHRSQLTRSPRRIVLWVAAVFFVIGGLAASNPLNRYLLWRNLSVDKLDRMIDSHLHERHEGVEYACLYTVTCASGRARLELRTSLSDTELDDIREAIWRRKFEDYCPGRTTNLGLEFLTPDAGQARRDIWTFGWANTPGLMADPFHKRHHGNPALWNAPIGTANRIQSLDLSKLPTHIY